MFVLKLSPSAIALNIYAKVLFSHSDRKSVFSLNIKAPYECEAKKKQCVEMLHSLL